MLRAGRLTIILSVVALTLGIAAQGRGDRSALVAMVIGRTGEVLHIATPQPVREGTIFAIKPFEGEDAIAEAEVLSCTHERPFIALARVIKGDTIISVPTGVRAYADASNVFGPNVPAPMTDGKPVDKNRFSLQVGAFYPRQVAMRLATTDYWQAYRLNYSLLKMGDCEALLSGEYNKCTRAFDLGGEQIRHTIEVVPVTATFRFKSLSLGSAHVYLGAGAGFYGIRSQETIGTQTSSITSQEIGRELSAALESTHGWVVELRYRNVQNTDIEGYSLTMGARF